MGVDMGWTNAVTVILSPLSTPFARSLSLVTSCEESKRPRKEEGQVGNTPTLGRRISRNWIALLYPLNHGIVSVRRPSSFAALLLNGPDAPSVDTFQASIDKRE